MATWQSVAAVQTERVLRLVREVFGRDVLGAYEHGSAVLGGVQPTSDVDILVIPTAPASLLEKASARGGPDDDIGPVAASRTGALC
jgi:streptomycin 3"-adenylyltransferase